MASKSYYFKYLRAFKSITLNPTNIVCVVCTQCPECFEVDLFSGQLLLLIIPEVGVLVFLEDARVDLGFAVEVLVGAKVFHFGFHFGQ